MRISTPMLKKNIAILSHSFLCDRLLPKSPSSVYQKNEIGEQFKKCVSLNWNRIVKEHQKLEIYFFFKRKDSEVTGNN